MKPDVEGTIKGASDESVNPYKDFTEEELQDIIAQSKNVIADLENDVFDKCSKKIRSPDDSYLEEIGDMQKGLFVVRHQIGQVAETLLDRIDTTDLDDQRKIKALKKMREMCLRIDKKTQLPFERITHAIKDYQYAFPREASSILKKMGQVGVLITTTTVLARSFVGDDFKTQSVAAGGALVLGTFLANREHFGRKNGVRAPQRKEPLERYEIRQIYAYLS